MTNSSGAHGGRTVVVTGAAGFIGRHLCQALVDSGFTVRALDLRPRALVDTDKLTYRVGDIREVSAIEPVFAGADVVFHLASAHLEVNAAESLYRSINVDAVGDLVSVCKTVGVRRLIHTSSVGVYGHVRNPPAREDSAKRPTTIYERTKLDGEGVALRVAERLEQDIVVVRPAWVYGPGCPRTTKLIRALSRGMFFYVGRGRNLRHPIYIEDLIRGYLLAANAPPSVSGGIYLMAGPRAVELREFIEILSDELGTTRPKIRIPLSAAWLLGTGAEAAFWLLRRDPPFSRRSLSFFQADSAFDTTAAAKELEFTARVDLKEGLTKTVQSIDAPA